MFPEITNLASNDNLLSLLKEAEKVAILRHPDVAKKSEIGSHDDTLRVLSSNQNTPSSPVIQTSKPSLPSIADLKGSTSISDKLSEMLNMVPANKNTDTSAIEQTLTKILDNHNDHASKIDTMLSAENDAVGPYVRPPEPVPARAVGKTLNSLVDRFTPEQKQIVFPENDNLNDFYKLSNRAPTEDDHNETMRRLMRRQSGEDPLELSHNQPMDDVGADKETPVKESHGLGSTLKALENNTTNILDVLKQIHSTVGDIEEDLAAAPQKGLGKGSRSGNRSGPRNKDSLSDALSEADQDDKDNSKRDQTTYDAWRNGKILPFNAEQFATGATKAATGGVAMAGGGLATLLGGTIAHNESAPSGGFDSKQQSGSERASGRNGGDIPSRIAAPGEVAQVVKSGPGYNVVKLGDGTIEKRTGTRNWRNNNPGNMNYGAFAKKEGAIGSDGRFAIFSNYKAGAKAREDLLFNTNGYKGKTIAQAIAKYAPPSENNTGKYVRDVSSALGVSPDTKMSALNEKQRQTMMNAIDHEEGFRSGKIQIQQKGTGKGQALNQASAKDSAKGPTIVVNNNVKNQNTHHSGGESKGPKKPPIPSTRSHLWDGWSKYFSL